MNATIYALFYGDHHDLHTRLLLSLANFCPKGGQIRFRFWCNQVCRQTQHLFKRKYPGEVVVVERDENVPKYKAMREMFKADADDPSDWVVWFDDDSYINKKDWWVKTVSKIQSDPDICYVGQPWYVHHLPGQWKFIQEAEWFTGRESELCATRSPTIKKPGITFAQGAYWWLRSDVLEQLDWPDPRLSHNGGDTLLGEAVRQQSLPFTKFHYGVAINKAKRRGQHEKPAGSKVDTRR